MRIYTQLLSECMNEYDSQLFDFDYGMTDYYKPFFELKFLLRFGYRNIGFESFPMFKQMLRSSLLELMPKYNKLYESENTPFNPFINHIIEGTDFTDNKGRSKDYATNNNKNIGYSDSSSGSMSNGAKGINGGDAQYDLQTSTGNTKDKRIEESGKGKINLFTDTPQSRAKEAGAAIDGTEPEHARYFNDGYLTTKSYDKESATDMQSANQDRFQRTADEKTSQMYQNAQEFSNAITQNTGINRGQSYSDREQVASTRTTSKHQFSELSLKNVQTSDVIKNWRSTFINIDKMLLDELEELFIQVY